MKVIIIKKIIKTIIIFFIDNESNEKIKFIEIMQKK